LDQDPTGGWAGGSGRRGSGGGAMACGGGSPGKPRKRVPGLGFERGLDGEVERDEGNPIRVIRRGHGGRNGGTTVGGGAGRRRGRAGAGEREREGKAAGKLHYPAVKLWTRLAAAKGRRNDGVVAAQGARQWRRRRAHAVGFRGTTAAWG
jgi:hypothetical protein